MNLPKRLFPPTKENPSQHELVLAPGEIEEALNFMASPGKIDVSELSFTATPHEEEPDVNNHYPDTLVEIAVFELPTGCSSHSCVLSKAGIGLVEEHEGHTNVKMCENGRLSIDRDVYQGHHLQILVPGEGAMKKHIRNKLDAKRAQRYYEVVIANCDENGRQVSIQGQVVFEFSLDDNTPILPSLDLPDIQYLVVSVSTFLFLVLCCFRVRCASRSSYEAALQQDEDVEMTGGEVA